MKKYDVHDYKTGKVHESVGFMEVIEITGVARNSVGKYARKKFIKAGRWCIVYHGEQPAAFTKHEKKVSKVSPTKEIRFSPKYILWFTTEWDNLPIIKHYRRGTLQ